MGSITIRNVGETIKQGARLEAVKNGRSMEAEIRALLERTYSLNRDERAASILAMSPAEFIAHMIATANDAELDLPDDGWDQEDIEFPKL